MGLLSAISNAVSGLNVNQQNLDVLSQNIANANTPNYSTEVVNQQASFIDGQGTGVTVGNITRTINNFLNAEAQTQTSINGAATAVQGYYTDIENLLGQPGGTNSIDQGIDSFFTAVQDLANNPSVEAQTTVVNTGENVAGQISTLANSLYGLQLQSDSDISSAVSSINADLKNLYTINGALDQAAATNQSTAGLLDQRDKALNDIAQYIGITPTYQEDGEVTVSTTGGTTLLTPGTLSQLSYQSANGTQTFINNDSLSPLEVSTVDASGNPVGVPSILATGGKATSVTTSLTGGSIQGLLSVRDSVIPNILNQLDELASNLRDEVNSVTNAGTSFPPPNSYTGQRLVSASGTSQYSGNLQIALLNSDGSPVGSTGGSSSPIYSDELNGVQPLTLNLSTLNYGQGNGVLSANDIVNAINQFYTPQPKLELGNLNNVQLALASNTVTGADGSTLSFGFNVNNIVSSSVTNSNAAFTVTGATIYAGDPSGAIVVGTTGGLSTTVGSGQTVNTNTQAGGTLTATLNSSAASASYFTVVATIQTVDSSGATVMSQVSYQIPNSSTNVDNNLIGATAQTGNGTIMTPSTTNALVTASLVNAAGDPLPETNGSYGNQEGYLKITADNSSQTLAINEMTSTQASTGQGVSQYFGLNNFFNVNSLTATGDTLTNSALNLSVESRIASNPNLLSTGVLSSNQPTDSSEPSNFTYGMNSGANSISQALAGLATTALSFDAAGGMPSSTTTLAQYAGQIIANTSTNSTNATNTATDSQTQLNGFTARAQAVSGVNLDQELANTVIYQNAYTASTRVITVVSDLFTALMSIIQ